MSSVEENSDRSSGTEERAGATAERQLYQELRLALVFNGGVSLAVWMGGTAKEIDRFRCAFSNGNDELVARLGAYRELLEVFRTVLITDVIAGASAGGINGALLAYVVANGKSLECAGSNAIRETWQTLGSMSDLLYTDGEPKSVLKTDEILFAGAASVFRDLQQAQEALSNDVSQWVRLAVTATDTEGYTVSVPGTGGRTTTGKDHRLLMRFRRIERPSGAGLRLSEPLRAAIAAVVGQDLRSEDAVKFLARAARTTASFPVAFAPSELPLNHVTAPIDPESEVRELTATPPMAEIVEAPSGPDLLEPITEDPNAALSRWAIDGGVWDNSPFSAVLRAAEKTPSGRDVRRVVTYLVGTFEPGSDRSPVKKPSLISPLAKAITLPTDVSFANDLERIGADLALQTGRGDTVLKLLGGVAPTGGAPDLFEIARQLFPIYRDTLAAASEADALLLSQELFDAPTLPAETESVAAWLATPESWGWGIQPARRSIQEARRLLRLLLRTVAASPAALPSDEIARLIETRELLSQLAWVLDDLAGLVTAASDADQCRAVCGQAMGDFAAAVSGVETIASTAGEGVASITAQSSSLNDLQRAVGAAATLTSGGADMVLKRALALDITLAGLGVTTTEAIDYDFTAIRPEPVWPGAVVPTPKPPRRPPLAGASMNHFGGFMRASWRLHDWMWGRLDANRGIVDLLITRERLEHLVEFGAGSERIASKLARFVIPDPAGPDGYANSRTLALHAFNAHGFPTVAASGPESAEAIAATESGQAELISGWRAALADEYAGLLSDVASADDNVIQRFRADVARRFRFAIVNEELPDLIETCKKEGAVIDDTATLLRQPDVALIRLNSTALCPKPSLAELAQDGENAAANLFYAVGSGVSGRPLSWALNEAGKIARDLARTTSRVRALDHALHLAGHLARKYVHAVRP
jgi:predicted acylesterase/phospholipase RssA